MRRALRLEGINPNFSLTNVWRAVELLSSESLRGNPNLREEMALLGFSRSPARQATTAPEIARLADSEQFVEIPLQVPANSIITVASLQEAQSACNLATSIEILESALPLIPSNMHSAYRSGMENMRSSGARAIRFENGSLANLAPPSSANSLTTPSRFPAPPGEYSTSFGFFPAGTETRGDFSRTLTDRPDQLPYFSLRVAGGEDSPILNPQGVRARLRTDALWPRVTYSLNLMDRTHLPLGGVNPQLRLRDLRVVVPQRVLAQQNGVYRFSNVETSVETEVQANGKTYIECLQRKLTENAQTSGSETGQGTGGGTGQTPAR
jgi:hypothetical protein